MEISLRKAYSFSKALIEQSKALSLKNNIEVSIYTSNVDEDVSKAIDLFQKNLEIANEYVSAAFELRHLVSEGNNKTVDGLNINALLNERADLEVKEKIIASLIGNTGRGKNDIAGVKRQIEIALTRQKSEYYGSDTISVSILSEEKIEELKTQLAALRRRKSAINDNLLVANSKITVKISEKTASVLQEAELI